ncbi:MAG: histidine kinase dimerization/phospho-acceptor domain-containing protein, partial [Verrucomicrobiota bacterium]|nr:histidine kinase dimerization/phospho-acceptor domain-containing protein [Verrucomicrobiota bacterium]
MKFLRWESWRKLPQLLQISAPEPELQRVRLHYMERNIALPIKWALIPLLFYYFYYSHWFEAVTTMRTTTPEVPPREIVLDVLRNFFLLYVIGNLIAGGMLLMMQRFRLQQIKDVCFHLAWVDALFFSALTLVTGGFDSILYWAFPGLIIRNTVSHPEAQRQIPLNLFVSGSYMLAGISDLLIKQWEYSIMDEVMKMALADEWNQNPTEPFILRLALLLLLTASCFVLQVVLEKQRRAEEESREYSVRQEQLQAAGRLAAEIAHQLKNPLGIINNAAYTLQRTVKEGKTITQQIQIIREEVDRSDRILTEL